MKGEDAFYYYNEGRRQCDRMLLPLNKKKGGDIIITMKGEDIVLRTNQQKQVDQL